MKSRIRVQSLTSTKKVTYSFRRPGEAPTAGMYCNQVDDMMRKIAIKHPRLVNKDRPILLQDNAQTTLLKLQELDVKRFIHQPYSPHLAPTNYHIFQPLDHLLQDKNSFRQWMWKKLWFRRFSPSRLLVFRYEQVNVKMAEMCWLFGRIFSLISFSVVWEIISENSDSKSAISYLLI